MPWEIFTKERAQLVMREVLSTPDRITAVVSGALLDDGIDKLLRANLVQQNERLFEPHGPLSSASGKIDVAHALGFFGEHAAADLRRINWIRNQFAHNLFMRDSKHQLTTITFETQSIADRCRQLYWTDRVLFWGTIPEGKTEEEVRSEPRFRFVNTVSLFASCIELVLNEYPSIMLVPGSISPCIISHVVTSTPQNRQQPQRQQTQPTDSRETIRATGGAVR